MYKENDHIDYVAREKYRNMTIEELEKKLLQLESEARKKTERIKAEKINKSTL